MDKTEAIDPFPAPKFLTLGSSSPSSINTPDMSGVLAAIYAIVFFIWVAYSLISAYHWFRYGHRSFLAVPLLAMHVVISITLLLVIAAGLR
ncbi:MAG TPA: hypothetical protein VF696_00190 [Candidatus Paceibacterota bacterium]|jgi:hypothetical protein